MRFEWDEAKNERNIRTHSLDFADAWEIFESPVVVGEDDQFDYGEVRMIAVGLLRGLVVVLVYTERAGDILRIISLRRARRNERQRS